MIRKLLSSIGAFLTLLLSLILPGADTVPDYESPEQGLAVHFLDVGQADCALLECEGEFMLIDGGNADDGRMVISYLRQMGVRTLSHVVCTHAHEDHAGGLSAVLSVFDAGAVYAPVSQYDSSVFRDFLRKTENQGLTLTVPEPGDRFSLGSAEITLLGPVKDYENVNDTSLVLHVRYGETDFLFTGDMETTAETDLLDHWAGRMDWNMEVLKTGHHGSDTSTGYRLLYELQPEYAVISVGADNTYGHPHENILSRLRDAGASVFRTDRLGHIIAATDGETLTFLWENQNRNPQNARYAQCILYGNKKSGIFHPRSCSSLPAKGNRVEFSGYDEAVAQGYSPCGSCLGSP